MKKIIVSLLLLGLTVLSYAEIDPIAEINNDTLAHLNEQLRKLDVDEKVKADANDTSSGFLSDKVQNSIVVNTTTHKMEFSGDASAPGNNTVYGTNSTGVKGWKADPTVPSSFWEHSGTQVFSSSAPTGSYADLDLSGVVGANYAFVALRVYSADSAGDVRFRPNGESAAFGYQGAAGAPGVGGVNGQAVVICCETDSAGVVEWIAEIAATTTVTVLGYIK